MAFKQVNEVHHCLIKAQLISLINESSAAALNLAFKIHKRNKTHQLFLLLEDSITVTVMHQHKHIFAQKSVYSFTYSNFRYKNGSFES